MVGRTIAQPRSLDETLAKSQASMADQDFAKPKAVKESFDPSQQQPLAHDRVKVKHGITFAHEDELPKLPIPELESSLKKYKNVLEPLQTRREQSDTAAAVEDFLKSEGPELQDRLKKYAFGKTSYIEQFCNLPKLLYRDPCSNLM